MSIPISYAKLVADLPVSMIIMAVCSQMSAVYFELLLVIDSPFLDTYGNKYQSCFFTAVQNLEFLGVVEMITQDLSLSHKIWLFSQILPEIHHTKGDILYHLDFERHIATGQLFPSKDSQVL
jgi:hypothetical protein